MGTLALEPTATLSGLVRVAENGGCNPGLLPPADTRVVVTAPATGVISNPVDNDAFQLAGVLSGSLELVATAEGYLSEPRTVRVDAGGTVVGPDPLCMQDVRGITSAVTGSVVTSPGVPESALSQVLRLELVPAGRGTTVRADVTRAGFTVPDVPAGVYVARVELPSDFVPLRVAWATVREDGAGLGELVAWPREAGEPSSFPDIPASSSSSSPSSPGASSSLV
jgi:hypothetical protein